ncbi:hypothetical protein ACFX2C_044186 [Malus domestica]
MRLSSFIGTISTFVVLNLTNAWSRTCRWPKPWLVAEALASGHALSLSSNILAHLFRCLAKMTLHKIYPYQNGPLWVFQFWLQVYFASLWPAIVDFSLTEALGPQLVSRPTPPHQAEEVFRYFFALDDLSNDEFLICRRREYPSSIRLPTSMWGVDEDADLHQSWGSFVLTRDLLIGCDGKRAGWEVYHPNFLARQLGYLQGCPVLLFSSRTVLSRGREPGSSEKEYNIAKREFQEQCQSFRLRPATPKTLSTDGFFSTPVEDVLNKVFGARPTKASVPHSQGSRLPKKGEAVVVAAAEKKSTLKRAKATAWALLSKKPHQEPEPTIDPSHMAKRVKKLAKKRERPCQEAETTIDPSLRPAKRVKTLAKKGEREIHVISSQTTGATPSVSPSPPIGQALVEKQPTSTAETVQARPVSEVGTPVVVSSVEAVPVLEKAVPATKRTPTAYPKPLVLVLEESKGSDEVPLASHPHSCRQPPSVSEVAVPVSPSMVDRDKRPADELEVTVETPVHPQDQDLNIPSQEATSAFASWEVEFRALLSSTTGGAGPSAAATEAADSTALTRLQEVLSLSASQVLERNGLDLLGACLNNLGADGQLSGEAIVQASFALERVQETFSIFQNALKAEQDLQAATTVQDTLRPKIDALKAKGEALADLDRQMAELAKRRSAIASELAKDFESGGKACLTEYATNTKWVEQLNLEKKNRQVEVIMGEVRWLELKALLGTFLPSSP